MTVASASCDELAHAACGQTGGDRHGVALLLLGIVAAGLVALHLSGRTAAAGLGLIALGVAALVIAIADDLPETSRKGAVGVEFVAAHAHAGAGFWLEVAGGAIAIGAGLAALLLTRARVSGA